MKYGAMNFPITPVLEEIETFSRLGFDYLELAMDPPMAHYSVLASIKTHITTALKENQLGLICHLPTFVSTADLTDSIRNASISEMQNSLTLAADLGAKKAVLHPSMVVGMGGYVMDTVKEYALDFLSQMTDSASSIGISLCLENMFPRNVLGVEPFEFTKLLGTFPTLKLTLDTGHANIAAHGNDRMDQFLDQFGHRIGHLHFSDNHGYRDDHLPIGDGIINFRRLIRGIKKCGYDDTLTLEVFDQNRQNLVSSREQLCKILQSV